MKTCEVEGCEREHYAKGLCKKHYRRLLAGGDPHAPGRSPEERLKAKLAPQDPVTGCIEWTGTRNRGYGYIRRDGKTIRAHRLAYELKHGPIPKGLYVCHRCDNRSCCNTDHHFLGTNADNMADMVSKGRSNKLKGEEHGRAKLTEADVAEILRRLAAGEFQRVIAAAFGISRAAISKIKAGLTWTHVA
jgi:hypothetical protein